MKKNIIVSLLITVMLFAPAIILAKDIIVGSFIMVPQLNAGFKTEDNVFLSPSDGKADIIGLLDVGATFKHPFGENSSIRFGGGLNIEQYKTFDSESMTGGVMDVRALLDMREAVIEVAENWRNTKERSTNELFPRARKYKNTFDLRARTKGLMWSFEVKAINIDEDYRADEDRYRDNNSGVYGLVMRYKPDENANYNYLAEYNYGNTSYDASYLSDSDFHRVFVGAEGTLNDRTSLSVKVGAQKSDYDEEVIDDPDTTFVADVLGTYTLSNDDRLEINYAKKIANSIYEENNYIDIHSVRVTYTHVFTEELSASALASYTNIVYPLATVESGVERKRDDDLTSIGIGVDYQFPRLEWMRCSASYLYEQRDSNHAVYDYEDNTVTVMFNLSF